MFIDYIYDWFLQSRRKKYPNEKDAFLYGSMFVSFPVLFNVFSLLIIADVFPKFPSMTVSMVITGVTYLTLLLKFRKRDVKLVDTRKKIVVILYYVISIVLLIISFRFN